MRTSTIFFVLVALQAALLGVLAVDANTKKNAAIPQLTEKRALVREYGLTDLCLFTEARYTRHPSLADQHSPFQDGPLSLEHFPTGSLVSPPPMLMGRVNND